MHLPRTIIWFEICFNSLLIGLIQSKGSNAKALRIFDILATWNKKIKIWTRDISKPILAIWIGNEMKVLLKENFRPWMIHTQQRFV